MIAIVAITLFMGLSIAAYDSGFFGPNLNDAIFFSHPAELFDGVVLNAFFYLFLIGTVHLASFAFICLLLIPLVLTRGVQGYVRLISRVLEFEVALLLWSVLGNLIWVAAARYKLYVPPDPVVEWVAFLPYSSNVYDYDFGGFRGRLLGATTDAHLFLLWAMIALFVWAATFRTVRRSRLAATPA